jgi:hypothetical protein
VNDDDVNDDDDDDDDNGHPASYTMGTRSYFLGGKAAVT